MSATACPCHGAYNTGVPNADGPHYVWMAFLHLDNGDYRQEEWGRDYRFLPMNRLTCWLSNSDVYHCQLFFWRQADDCFETISVDANQREVFADRQKQFSYGWTFLRLQVTQQQERRMYTWLRAQLGKPFNMPGALMLFVRPVPTWGTSWFCSQLGVAALQAAGFFADVQPEAVNPAQLMHMLQTAGEMPVLESTHPVRTKQLWRRVDEHVANGTRPAANERLFDF